MIAAVLAVLAACLFLSASSVTCAPTTAAVATAPTALFAPPAATATTPAVDFATPPRPGTPALPKLANDYVPSEWQKLHPQAFRDLFRDFAAADLLCEKQSNSKEAALATMPQGDIKSPIARLCRTIANARTALGGAVARLAKTLNPVADLGNCDCSEPNCDACGWFKIDEEDWDLFRASRVSDERDE